MLCPGLKGPSQAPGEAKRFLPTLKGQVPQASGMRQAGVTQGYPPGGTLVSLLAPWVIPYLTKDLVPIFG